MPRTTLKVGLPFKGYRSSMAPYLLPRDYIARDSRNVRFDPLEGKWLKRLGTRVFGGQNGIVETGPAYGTMRGYDMQEMQSSSLVNTGNGTTTICALISDDSNNVGISGMIVWMSDTEHTVALCSQAAGSPTLTTLTANGFQDVSLGVRISHNTGSGIVLAINSTTNLTVNFAPTSPLVSQNATVGDGNSTSPHNGLWRSIGHRYGATHYPNNFKMVPNLAGAVGLTRCSSATPRSVVALGSRNFIQVQDELYLGNYKSAPIRWNKQWNDRLASGTTNERCFPMGHIMPLWPPIVVAGSVAGSTVFKQNESVWITTIFQRKDGSWSRMCLPQLKNGAVAGHSDIGLYTVTANCSTLNLTDIAKGPDGTTARAVIWTPFAASGLTPAILDENGLPNFGYAAIIPNNTNTTCVLTTKAFAVDPINIRLDDTAPPPCRYLWTGDGRVWGGYIAPEPRAFVMAPFVNNDDDTISADVYSFRVDLAGSQIRLTKNAGTTAITCSAATTIQDVIDQINATTDSGSNGGKWKAQLWPGADPNTTGEKLFDTLAYNIGDSAVGEIRCFSNSWPGLVFFNTAYLGNYPALKRSIWFSPGGPGAAAMAANNTVVKNRRQAPESWGQFMGGAALLDGQVCCFAKAIGICRNIKGGKSGVDEDYRLEELNVRRGCIAPQSITSGDGWVGYMTVDGYVITDGTREVIISGDLYNPAGSVGQKGDWEQAITFDTSYASRDNANTNFCADVLGSQLRVNCPTSGGNAQHMIYDFSAGVAGSGLDEMLRPDGSPWGWSSPYTAVSSTSAEGLPMGPMCQWSRLSEVRNMVYQAVSGTGVARGEVLQLDAIGLSRDDGLRQQIFNCTTNTSGGTANIMTTLFSFDLIAIGAVISHANVPVGATVLSKTGTQQITMSRNATAAGSATATFTGLVIDADAFSPQDMVGSTKKKAVLEATTIYRSPSGTATALRVANRKDRSNLAHVVVGTTSGDFDRKVVRMPQSLRGQADIIELNHAFDVNETGEPSWSGAEVLVDVLDSSN